MADFYFANNQQVTTNKHIGAFVLMGTMEEITECYGRKLVVGEGNMSARERKPAGVASKLSCTKDTERPKIWDVSPECVYVCVGVCV